MNVFARCKKPGGPTRHGQGSDDDIRSKNQHIVITVKNGKNWLLLCEFVL